MRTQAQRKFPGEQHSAEDSAAANYPAEERKAVDHQRRGNLLVGAQFALLGVIAASTSAGLGPGLALPGGRILGGGLLLTGALVGGAALLTMGRATRVHPVPAADGRLFTNGVYAYVRHPMYAAVLLVSAGLTLSGGRALALLGMLGLAGVLRAKMQFEEKLLEREFGWQYSVYATHVPALLPSWRRR